MKGMLRAVENWMKVDTERMRLQIEKRKLSQHCTACGLSIKGDALAQCYRAYLQPDIWLCSRCNKDYKTVSEKIDVFHAIRHGKV